jgi:transcriptional regulator with XRE-family HTH domain
MASDTLSRGLTDRIKKVRGEMAATKFAESLGVTAQYIYDLEAGRKTKISDTLAELISVKYNISKKWLLFDEGPVFADDATTVEMQKRFWKDTKKNLRSDPLHFTSRFSCFDVGKRIRELRGDESQVRFAKKIGISLSDLNRIEQAEAKKSDLKRILGKASLSRSELDWILSEKDLLNVSSDVFEKVMEIIVSVNLEQTNPAPPHKLAQVVRIICENISGIVEMTPDMPQSIKEKAVRLFKLAKPDVSSSE